MCIRDSLCTLREPPAGIYNLTDRTDMYSFENAAHQAVPMQRA